MFYAKCEFIATQVVKHTIHHLYLLGKIPQCIIASLCPITSLFTLRTLVSDSATSLSIYWFYLQRGIVIFLPHCTIPSPSSPWFQDSNFFNKWLIIKAGFSWF